MRVHLFWSTWLGSFGLLLFAGCSPTKGPEEEPVPPAWGQTTLVYELDHVWLRKQKAARKPIPDSEAAAAALKRRLDPNGIQGVTVRKLEAGVAQFEIVVPRRGAADELEGVKRLLTQAGKLEFRQVADQRDEADMFKAAEDNVRSFRPDKTNTPSPPPGSVSMDYEWVELGPREVKDREYGPMSPKGFVVEPPVKGPEGGATGNAYRYQGVFHAIGDFDGDGKEESRHFLLTRIPFDADGKPLEVTDKDLAYVAPQTDPRSMQWVVRVAMSTKESPGGKSGVDRLFELTAPAKAHPNDRALAIILDGQVIMAPHLQTQLSEGAIITLGRQDDAATNKRRVDELVLVLSTGPFPIPLNPQPLREETIQYAK